MKAKNRGRPQSIFYFILLASFLPISLLIYLGALFSRITSRTNSKMPTAGINILLTGGKMTKSLQLARLLNRAGHNVYLSETSKFRFTGHKFSSHIEKFFKLPNIIDGYDAYFKNVQRIVKRHQINLIIPVASPKIVYFDSEVKEALQDDCEFFHFDKNTLKILDNKYLLCKTAKDLNITAPEVHYIVDREQLNTFDFKARSKKYILKSLTYNPLERLNRPQLPFPDQLNYFGGLTISKKNPWVLQEFVDGVEYCTHSTVRDGKILLHCCCLSSDFQLRYKHVEHDKIFEWVETFVAKLKLSGQISFDFIQNSKGEILPIECNPRTHSAITSFYNSEYLAEAYVSSGLNSRRPVLPEVDARETYWLYHELFDLFSNFTLSNIKEKITLLLNGKEAIFDEKDPLPFLMVYHWQIPNLLARAIISGERWLRIDFNIGKLVEPGGD